MAKGSAKGKGLASAKGVVRGGKRKPKDTNPRGYHSKKG